MTKDLEKVSHLYLEYVLLYRDFIESAQNSRNFEEKLNFKFTKGFVDFIHKNKDKIEPIKSLITTIMFSNLTLEEGYEFCNLFFNKFPEYKTEDINNSFNLFDKLSKEEVFDYENISTQFCYFFKYIGNNFNIELVDDFPLEISRMNPDLISPTVIKIAKGLKEKSYMQAFTDSEYEKPMIRDLNNVVINYMTTKPQNPTISQVKTNTKNDKEFNKV